MSTIEMPKTYKERLDEIEVGESLVITDENRQLWANQISILHRDTKKQFTIRTNRETRETRVWRLKDIE